MVFSLNTRILTPQPRVISKQTILDTINIKFHCHQIIVRITAVSHKDNK